MAADAGIKIDIATEFTGKKAFSNAEKATQKLSKGVKNLAGAFGLAFGTRAIAMYAKKAINAFAADEKAARSLALQLKNTGNAFAQPGIELFIANLERSTGILDEVLRPSFQTLLTSLGDVALAQKTLSLALDVSAGTGKDLQAVSLGLAKGYLGNTTSLTRLGAGLTKNILATGDMVKITDVLSKKFSGQARSAVQGYSGQMALLTVASENSQEIIGKGLLDAISSLGKNESVSNLADDMESVATQTANVIRGIGKLVATIKNIPGLSSLSKLVGMTSLGGIALKALSDLGASAAPKGYGSSNTVENFLAMGGVIKKNTVAFKANTAGVKAKTELDKLAAKFDVERIGLYAALANATSEEEKARIRAKIAILEQNEAAAKALNMLSDAAFNAATSVSTMTASQIALANSMSATLGAMLGSGRSVYDPGSGTSIMPSTNVPAFIDTSNDVASGIRNQSPYGQGGDTTNINVTVSAGTITNEQGVVDVVQQALQEINARGWSQYRTGALQVL